MATKVTATTERGGRKLAETTRDKLRAKGRATWESMTPEQRAKSMANLAAGRAKIGTKPPPAPSTDPPPAPPATGGPRNPLDDAPGARPDPRPQPQGRLNGHTNGHAAPPVFRIPDLPPLELGEPGNDDAGGTVSIDGGAGNITVSVDQVGTLLAFPFDFVALRRGKHWKLRDDERAMIAEPLARKLNEHAAAARLVSAGGDWTVIIGGLAIIVTARVMEDGEHGTGSPGGAPAGDGSRSSGVPAIAGDPDGDGDPRPGPDGRPGRGRLNGFSLGEAPPGSTPADAAQAPSRPLVQAFSG